ncbi:MAG: phosphopyruvate hydratase [Legionella sp.]
MQIADIKGRQIIDSRGNPTVEADVILKNGARGRASVPSGASTGSREACELRDGDHSNYCGRGVLQAVSHINQAIKHALFDISVANQEQIDAILCQLDGTADKSRLGANAILAVSLACARAYAQSMNVPLCVALNQGDTPSMPVPMMNILNGGVHANNNIDIQEFMIMPVGATDIISAIQMGVEVFHALKSILIQKGLQTSVGDEGGFAPNLNSNSQALDMLAMAVEMAGFRLGDDIVFALDVAASELYDQKLYHLTSEKKSFTSEQLIDYYEQLAKNYPIISIEDGLDENDWFGWQQMTAKLGNQLQLVGDDLFVTNSIFVQRGIDTNAANAVLIKLNQIGTLSETRRTMSLATKHGYRCIMSHRSGETEDVFIADLAVASGCGQIKTGSLCRTDRVAKYNQLLRINEYMKIPYAGKQAFSAIAAWCRSHNV